jgi:arylsulfatase A-like enzyme
MIVILYVMDSLRPDFLSCYGHRNRTSPHIDALAQDGVLFTHAFAQSTWTRPSAASILTSTYPSVHGVLYLDHALPHSVPILPAQLKRRGFRTVGVSCIGNVSTDFGFGRGFDQFIEPYKDRKMMERRVKIEFDRAGWTRRDFAGIEGDSVPLATSEDINDAISPFLEENRGEDLFLFLWSMDTHDPYCHRDPAMTPFRPSEEVFMLRDALTMTGDGQLGTLKALYEDMIYYNDHHIGKLVGRLKELGLYEDTFLIITADHGEAFGEHGFNGHGREPYDEEIRVPVIMKFPHSEFSGRRSALVQHIDISPTIYHYIDGAEASAPNQGKSLLPLLRTGTPVNDFVLTEYLIRADLPRYTAARTADHKYIEYRLGKPAKGRIAHYLRQLLLLLLVKPRMLFSLEDDPEEKTNIARGSGKVTSRFHDLIRTLQKENKRASRHVSSESRARADVDDEVAKQLKALGYFE